MSRILQVTLHITVEDLDDAARAELAELEGNDPDDEEENYPLIQDYNSGEVAQVLEYLGNPDAGISDELFAGSDVLAKFTDVTVVGSAWIDQ